MSQSDTRLLMEKHRVALSRPDCLGVYSSHAGEEAGDTAQACRARGLAGRWGQKKQTCPHITGPGVVEAICHVIMKARMKAG